MNRDLRTPIIAGNWKMNKNPFETREFFDKLNPLVSDANCEVVVCTPFIDLATAVDCTQNTGIKVGAENCHWEDRGAFTGEISATSIKDVGVEYVILGHSERRLYFGETSETVCKRMHSAIHNDLKPIMCVGEQLSGREQGITYEIVRTQLKLGLKDIPEQYMKEIIIAYEPVWAIGTGKTATASQAEEICALVRKTVAELYSDGVAERMPVLYGGSMNARNADELLSMPDIDGGLIGGASLIPGDFAEIIKIASNK